MTRNTFQRLVLGVLALLVACSCAESVTVDADFVASQYTKQEVQIPMRDGVKLYTIIYSPRDTSRNYPFMMIRTPYSAGPYGAEVRSVLGPSEYFTREKYHFVYQDVRGAFMSEGEFLDMRPLNLQEEHSGPGPYTDEATDTWDTVDWLLEHVEGNNGRVGMWGISYPGGYTSMGLASKHPALVAASPQAPTTDWFVGDDFHRNGAFTHLLATVFFPRFGAPRPEPVKERTANMLPLPDVDLYGYLLSLGTTQQINDTYLKGQVRMWNDFIAHDTYDTFWQQRAVDRHLGDVTAAVLTVGGWFDPEDPYGPLATYKAIKEGPSNSENILVMGPWYHGGWARAQSDTFDDINLGSLTARQFFQQEVEHPFFLHHLKDGPDPDLPEALMYDTGAGRWHRFDTWPAADIQPMTLYLADDETLLIGNPGELPGDGNDAFLSDPNHPVPFMEGPVHGWNYGFMHADQRYAARRPDVLVYVSEPLDQPLTLAGPIEAELFVSTTGTDADWVVKIIDVFPDDYPEASPTDESKPMGGYQMLVRWEIMRGKFRNSLSKPEPFEPGAVTKVAIPVEDVLHTFRQGHRIMIQVHSSWFPIFDRNPQTFTHIHTAEAEDYVSATHRVFRNSEFPSAIHVGRLRGTRSN